MNKKLDLITKTAKTVGLILKELKKEIKEGVCGKDLEKKAKKIMEENNVSSSSFGYHGFPAHICVSVSNKKESELTHGIPTNIPFEDGDVISADVACFCTDENGITYHADAAITSVVGNGNETTKKLIDTTKECLDYIIRSIIPGKTSTQEIGKNIQNYIRNRGLFIIKEYGGHCIGHNLHEKPFIPNYRQGGNKKEIIKPGMFVCIEPLVQINDDLIVNKKIKLENDIELSVAVSKNNYLNAHFEHTVFITDNEAVILTNHDN